jgi:hypothetical protein
MRLPKHSRIGFTMHLSGRFYLTTILLSVIALSLLPQLFAATTEVKVNPSSSSIANVGDSASVNVTVAGVSNLAGWEFKLYYRRSVVNCTGIVEGPFLKSAGSTFNIFQINYTYNATHGRILAGCTLLGLGHSASGSGTLATVTFKAMGPGDSTLALADTKLAGSGDPPPSIPHTDTSGTIHVGAKIGDVNGDGVVNVLDLISVATKLGWSGPAGSIPQDINQDGKVNVLDLILVALHLGM